MTTSDRPVAPDSMPIDIRPIQRDDLDRIWLGCWSENRAVIERLFDEQETPGFAAWEGDCCVGNLHAYRVTLPNWDDRNFPEWTRDSFEVWPLGATLCAAQHCQFAVEGPVWAHSCFHVGNMGVQRQVDVRYFDRGIGTAFCRVSVDWAKAHGYSAVLALAAPPETFGFAAWFGILPCTTYERLGFAAVGGDLGPFLFDRWQDYAPPNVKQLWHERIEAGLSASELSGRLMVLQLS